MKTHFILERFHFSRQVSFDLRSLYTVLIYLNEVGSGGTQSSPQPLTPPAPNPSRQPPLCPHPHAPGETQLLLGEQSAAVAPAATDGASLARPECVLLGVKPLVGRALIYWHQTLHAGARVGSGSVKYCLRTDVMYERTPRQCVSPNDVEAYQTYQRARQLEVDGKTMEALEHFMRARKLSPLIAAAYGLT